MIANDDRGRVAERLRELGKLAYGPDNTYERLNRRLREACGAEP